MLFVTVRNQYIFASEGSSSRALALILQESGNVERAIFPENSLGNIVFTDDEHSPKPNKHGSKQRS